MHHYIHHTPGRLRLKFSQLKGRPELAAQVEREIRQVQGTNLVEANTVTGSVLVRYDARDIDQAALQEAVDQIGKRLSLMMPRTVSRFPVAQPSSFKLNFEPDNRVADKLLTAAVEKCIERGAVALLGLIL